MKLKIYGERNTGTNYLTKLIHLNFRNELLPGGVDPRYPFFHKSEFRRDLYFYLTYPFNLGWKHCYLKQPSTELLSKLNNTLVICLVKNPYSWLLSFYKKPYHAMNEVTSLAEFIESPWKTIGRESHSDFNNPIEMWNIKTSSYFQLADKYNNTEILRFEDLITDPKKTLDNLFKKYDLKVTSNYFSNITSSAKSDSRTHKDIKHYYLNERWIEKYNNKEIELINQHLDFDLINRLGYHKL